MGERAGYRVREGDEVSHILRKQWYTGDDMDLLVTDVVNVLATGHLIGSGRCALRDDLGIGRLSAALFSVVYDAPFDSIEFDTVCDISDHGLYEIEMVEWDHWKVWNYCVAQDGELLRRELLTEAFFEVGKAIGEEIRFVR